MTTATMETETAQEVITSDRERSKLDKESMSIARDFATWQIEGRAKLAKLGGRCWEYLLHAREVGVPEREAKDRLAEDLLTVTRTDYRKEIMRAIRAYQLTEILGPEVLEVPIDMQKAFTRFVMEDEESKSWVLDPRFAEGVTRLWAKLKKLLAKGKLPTSEQVRADLAEIRPIRNSSRNGDQPEGADTATSSREGWLTLPDPDGQPVSHDPDQCVQAASKALEASDDRPRTMAMLAARLEVDDLVEIVGSFCARLRDYGDPKKARQELDHLRSVIDERAKELEASLGRKPRGRVA